MHTLVRINACFAFLACLGIMGVTSMNLYTQGQLRGRFSGVQTRTYLVTQKGWRQSYIWNGFNIYWVSWTKESVLVPGNHRVEVTEERWNQLDFGDPITVAYPSLDSHAPYLRNDTFDSDGSIIFNIGIICCAFGVSIWMLVVLCTHKPRPLPPWEQPQHWQA